MFKCRLINVAVGSAIGLIFLVVGGTQEWVLPLALAATVLVSTYVVRVKTMWRQAPITAAVVIAAAAANDSSAIGIVQGLHKVAEVVFGCLVGMVVSLAMSKVWLIRTPTEGGLRAPVNVKTVVRAGTVAAVLALVSVAGARRRRPAEQDARHLFHRRRRWTVHAHRDASRPVAVGRYRLRRFRWPRRRAHRRGGACCRHHSDRLPPAHALPLGSRRRSGGAGPADADPDLHRRRRSGSESSGDVGSMDGRSPSSGTTLTCLSGPRARTSFRILAIGCR